MFTLYDETLYAGLIEPLLKRVPETNELAILWRALRKGDPLVWLAGLAVIGLILAQSWFDL